MKRTFNRLIITLAKCVFFSVDRRRGRRHTNMTGSLARAWELLVPVRTLICYHTFRVTVESNVKRMMCV